MTAWTVAQLEAYLDEALPAETMAEVEKALRRDPRLLESLAAIHARRDAGVHSVGEIWRRRRLTCPTREQWGSFLLGILDEGQAGYFRFHLETIGCRYCRANVDDLARQQSEARTEADRRRKKYFASSVGRRPKPH